MGKSNTYCELMATNSVSSVGRKIHPDVGSAFAESHMKVEAAAGVAMRPYVQLHKLIQE